MLKQPHAKKYRMNNWTQWKLGHIRSNAKQEGIEFNLTKDDITMPEFCPVLGIRLTYGSSKHNDDSCASVDRIDNSKGYIKGNIVTVSRRVNSIKRDATIQELITITNFYKQLTGEQYE